MRPGERGRVNGMSIAGPRSESDFRGGVWAGEAVARASASRRAVARTAAARPDSGSKAVRHVSSPRLSESARRVAAPRPRTSP